MRAIMTALLLAASGSPAHAADAGAALYASNCVMCHQAGGIGAAGRYPPLRGRINKIAASAEGRHYLANLMLFGMVGKIEAAGADYYGYMPAFRQLNDNQLAAILNWLSAEGGSSPAPVIAAAVIAGARAKPLRASGVAEQRRRLAALHPLP